MSSKFYDEIVLASGTILYSGTGSPEGVVASVPGNFYFQSGVGMWQKGSGSTQAGWFRLGMTAVVADGTDTSGYPDGVFVTTFAP